MNRIEQFYGSDDPEPIVVVSAKYQKLSPARKRKLLAMILAWASKELAKMEDVPTDKDE